MNPVESLIRPSSVAVVGASEDPNRMNGASIHNLERSGYTGEIFPVNPRRTEVQGRQCWPSLSALPKVPDTVIVVTPAEIAVSVLRDAVALGIPTATVIGSGFGEIAAKSGGLERERELRELVAEGAIRILGPNTAGLLNLADGYVPRAAHNHLEPEDTIAGRIALISQSGAIGNSMFNRAQAAGIGIHSLIGTGDQFDLTTWEIAAALLELDDVAVLGMVIEALGDMRQVAEVSRRARELGKPVVVLPLGTSEAGGQVAMSHTGSIASNGAVVEAVLRDAGFVTVDGFDQVWATCAVLEKMDGDAEGGRGLGVFCLSGGEAAFVADRLTAFDMRLTPPGEAFGDWVTENMKYASVGNPFDATGEILGQPDLLNPLLDRFIGHSDYSHVLICAPVLRDEIAQRYYPHFIEALQRHPGRVTVSTWSAGRLTESGISMLQRGSGAAVLDRSDLAIDAVARSLRYHRGRGEPLPLSAAVEPGGAAEPAPAVTYMAARALLDAAGLPFPPARVVSSADEAVHAATEIGYPVVLKGDVLSSTHKRAAGVVRTGLVDATEVREAFGAIQEAGRSHGVAACVIEPMAGEGIDLLVGAQRDAVAGPVLTIGLGGGMVELIEDVALAVGSFDEERVLGLVARTAVGRYLAEQYPEALPELARCGERLMAWFEGAAGYETAEINPLRYVASAAAWHGLDARIA